ncbi:hypothetical protein AB0H58_16775 [Nocardia neocaledoniensis]|uniref:hypothetical protein n=1 Tax=Nocardia neocaledoniensis TaxID=236511 RepID=UPI0033DDC099
MTPEEFDKLDALPDVLHGYRFDILRPTGRIGHYGAADVTTPSPMEPGDEPARWTPAARCLLGRRHAAPDWLCTCGWNVMCNLAEVAGYAPRYVTDIPARAVVVEATAHGPMFPGAAADDTETTVRATWLRLGDRIWIRKGVSRAVVSATRRYYPFARVERFHSLAELVAVPVGA